MILKNLSKNTILSEDLKFANSLFEKSLGLLNPHNSRSLLIKTRFGIHTFGLKFPIDVIVLSNKFKVVKLKTVFPNRIFLYNLKNTLVIELPEFSIKNSKTGLGDKLEVLE